MAKMILVFVLAVVSATAASGALFRKGTLSKGTVTEVVNQVSILSAEAETAKPAKTQDIVEAPNSVRTGAVSRAQLTAPDETITRVGANTVFSFTSASRSFDLKKGSLLFHSPKGKGGGTIKSGGASAAVLGTTLMVATTTDGGFKVIVLEGRGRVSLPNGRSIALKAGQMVFVLPQGGGASGVLDVHLKPLVAGSLLVNGFSSSLPSRKAIGKAIEKQERLIEKSVAKDTGQTADHIQGSAIVPLLEVIPTFKPPVS